MNKRMGKGEGLRPKLARDDGNDDIDEHDDKDDAVDHEHDDLICFHERIYELCAL